MVRNTKEWIVGYAASVMYQAEVLMDAEEMFPAYAGVHGSKTPSRHIQKEIIKGFIDRGWIYARRINSEELYGLSESGDRLRGLHTIVPSQNDLEELAEFLGISENQMIENRYLSVTAQRLGKLTVAIQVVRKLLHATEPLTRTTLFKFSKIPGRDNKYIERAAWTPTWHSPFLNGLMESGAVRAIGENPIKYEAVDKEYLKRISEESETNWATISTILWPDEKIRATVVPGIEEMAERMAKSTDPQPKPSSEILFVEPEPLEMPSHRQVLATVTHPTPVPPPAPTPTQAPTDSNAVIIQLLTKISEASASQSKGLELTLNAMCGLADSLSHLNVILTGIQDSLHEIQSKPVNQNKLQQTVDNLQSVVLKQDAALKQIASDLFIRKSKVKASDGILNKLMQTLNELETVKDLTLDAVGHPDRSTS